MIDLSLNVSFSFLIYLLVKDGLALGSLQGYVRMLDRIPLNDFGKIGLRGVRSRHKIKRFLNKISMFVCYTGSIPDIPYIRGRCH